MRRIRSHDQGFVAAPPGDVYSVISTPSTYPGWWAGSELAAGGLRIPVAAGVVERSGERDGVGLHLGSADVSLEWYLEPFDDGTIVNALLDLPAPRARWRARRRLLRKRGGVRRGLTGLKASMEAAR